MCIEKSEAFPAYGNPIPKVVSARLVATEWFSLKASREWDRFLNSASTNVKNAASGKRKLR
jgi:hypothetical protein